MNHLYYGDNLDVLRAMPGESVDLIYLDPPFNSNASYNVLFRGPKGGESPAQIEAFDDTWTWSDMTSGRALAEVKDGPYQDAARMLDAMVGFLGRNAMTAYLCMMGVRLCELHRVLKPTGSLYLHCDPTASHYLKVLLDGVFGATNFKNEIVWRRSGSHNYANRYGPIHDVILFFTKSNMYQHRPVFTPYLKGHVDSYFKKADERGRYWTNSIHGAGTRNGESGKPWRGYDPTAAGRHWAVPSELVLALGIDPDLRQHEKLDALADAGVIDFPDRESAKALPTYRQYLDNSPGQLLQDLWAYQPHTKGCLHGTGAGIDEDVRWLPPQGSKERLGYPTQKPVALLERILSASSNPGDTVLDPFCGCGTTVHAAQKLGRRWIGIDVTHLAINLIENRLYTAFGADCRYVVHGVPRDVDAARDFFERDDRTKKEFEKWALSLIKVQFQGKKGADGGVDGRFWFGRNSEGRAVVSVKGGRNVGVGMVRDLDSAAKREGADVGVLLTLEPPTRNMVAEAAQMGVVATESFGTGPRIQIVTVEDALRDGPAALWVNRMRHADTYKAAPREEDASSQGRLL